ncbi:hypothetical protein JCM10207_005054 [Rhodosporidiobolus poonsookiae]
MPASQRRSSSSRTSDRRSGAAGGDDESEAISTTFSPYSLFPRVGRSEDEEGHEASWLHELIAGAAAFKTQKAYPDHDEKNGTPQNHETAKELLAGFAAAAADRFIETKGIDFIDREKAKHEGRRSSPRTHLLDR